MTLFDVKVRTLDGPSKHADDRYTYYNDSARTDVACVRDLLESWFAKYPDFDKEDFKSRFKAAMVPTFYELYVYTLFTALGYTLEIHPDIDGTQKHPDYLARKGEELIYIEVKHLRMMSDSEQSLERRKNVILDAINKIDASNFLLKLERIQFKDDSQPRVKSIVHFFNQLIKAYDPDRYTEDLLSKGFDGMPEIVYDDDKITIALKLLPKSASHRGTKSRSIAAYPFETMWGNDKESLRDALEKKALRYGKLNAPFIICLNKDGVALDKIEINEALYGNLTYSWSTNPENRDERLDFNGNGMFGTKTNPRLTRLSGVYVTNANDANLGTTADHAFRHNPYAVFPINLSIEKSIKDLLQIPEDYPGRKLPDFNWGLDL